MVRNQEVPIVLTLESPPVLLGLQLEVDTLGAFVVTTFMLERQIIAVRYWNLFRFIVDGVRILAMVVKLVREEHPVCVGLLRRQ